MLAPTSSQKFLSYTTGWLNLCGWQATYIAATFLTGDLIQSLRSFTNPSYTSREWTTMLVMWACGLFALFLNAFSRTLLPRFQGFILLFHILGFVAIVTTLSVFGSRNSPATVFKGWLNEGDWSTQGLASMICLVQPALGFAGVDAPIHVGQFLFVVKKHNSMALYLLMFATDGRRNHSCVADRPTCDHG